MKKVLLLPVIAGVLLVVYLAWPRERRTAPLSAPPGATPAQSTATAPVSAPSARSAPTPARLAASEEVAAPVATPVTPQSAPLSAPAKAAALEAMHEAMVTYDPAKLPAIAAYLNHADEDLRQAALDNMIQMGEAAAAPLLRTASEKARSPQEALAMLDAADFLELPPAQLSVNRRPAPPADAPAPGSKPALGPGSFARP